MAAGMESMTAEMSENRMDNYLAGHLETETAEY